MKAACFASSHSGGAPVTPKGSVVNGSSIIVMDGNGLFLNDTIPSRRVPNEIQWQSFDWLPIALDFESLPDKVYL